MLRYMFVGLFLLLSGLLLAQEAPGIRNFTPVEYGFQNQNWAVAQAPNGWLYAANNDGLLEFDGARWAAYSLPDRQTLRTLLPTPSGKIFGGGYAEFGFWSPDDRGQLTYTSLSHTFKSDRLQHEEIWHSFESDNAVYFQSFSVIYKYAEQQVTEIIPPAAIMFATVINGQIWVPTIGQGIYELRPDGSFVQVPGTELLRDKIIQFLVPNGRGGVWIGTNQSGIFDWQAGQCTPWAHPLNEHFRQQQLNKAIALQQGGWAIGTILGGVYLLNEKSELLYQINRSNGLQNNTVLALQQDQQRNLWVGLDRGIDYVGLHSPLKYYTDQSGAIGAVYAAAQWHNRLYLGTNQGVFVQQAPNQGFRLVPGTQGQVWELQVFDGQLLAGHNSGTLLISDQGSERISQVTGGWCTIALPNRPDLLLQSTYTGLIYLVSKQGKWQFGARISGLGDPVSRIQFDQDGNLWGVHANRGVFRIALSNDYTRVAALQHFGINDGLPSDNRLDLVRVGPQLVINTEKGPVHPVVKEGKWQFEALHPHGNSVQKILLHHESMYVVMDSLGHLGGLSERRNLPLPLQLVRRFERVIPLSSREYLFCMDNGYALLPDSSLRYLEPTVAISSVYIRNVELSDGSCRSTQRAGEFSYAQNSLKFRFGCPFFNYPPRYAWYLEGFSKQWSPWQHSTEKEFTNLPEGDYTFRVRSETGQGEANFSFRIAPPWYRSTWAYGAYFLLAALAFWRWEQFNRRRLERQRHQLEIEKEREILMLEVENKNRELSNAAFNLIRKNEALQGLKDELLAAPNEPRTLQKMTRYIDEHLAGDHDWEMFEASFNRVHDDFFKRLMQQFPDLTPGDLRLAAYLKMNLASKEIAPLLNISIRGVENKRYRLRKKLGLPEEANLTEYIIGY
jgi:DNA-binding CsgD family transcriptional regulator